MAKTPNATAVGSEVNIKPGLPAVNQSGATVDTRYLQRIQEVVAVNRNDLEDLLDYDTSALSFGGFGLSLISGAAFILVEQWFSQSEGGVNTLMKVCLGLLSIGVFLAWQGKKMHDKKRGRIERIFRETREYQPDEKSGRQRGKNAAAR